MIRAIAVIAEKLVNLRQKSRIMRGYFELMRPGQWVKNVFVYLPMFFGGELLDVRSWIASTVAFASFCLLSSAIYCLNDIRDAESDRKHPRKKHRPVAAGRVSVKGAYTLMVILMAAAFGMLGMLRPEEFHAAAAIELAYLLLNLAYCFYLKRLAIIDVFTLAIGFVLRLADGGAVCDIELSPWIVCLTFLLALFLAFAKRRDDVAAMEEEGTVRRQSIVGYNLDFINITLAIIAAVTTVCYLLYTVSPDTTGRIGSKYVYITFIFVLAGILRYLMVTLTGGRSDSPTALLYKDRFVQACIAGWIISFAFLIYHG